MINLLTCTRSLSAEKITKILVSSRQSWISRSELFSIFSCIPFHANTTETFTFCMFLAQFCCEFYQLDTKRMVFVKNAEVREATTSEMLIDHFEKGNSMRHVSSTKMNSESSRNEAAKASKNNTEGAQRRTFNPVDWKLLGDGARVILVR